MQYRWNEPSPKGTTAEELSPYDPWRPRSGSEMAAGILSFLVLAFIVHRFFLGLFTLQEIGFWEALLNVGFFLVTISLVPLMAGAWIGMRSSLRFSSLRSVPYTYILCKFTLVIEKRFVWENFTCGAIF